MGFLIVAIAANLFTPSPAADESFIHPNGVEWIGFGPAVIESCKSIELHIYDIGDFKIGVHDKGFAEIKTWVQTKFGDKLNCSPNTPNNRSIGWPNSLGLYASEKPSDETLLLFVPLNSRLLETNDNDVKETLRNLASKMHAYRTIEKKGDQIWATLMVDLDPSVGWTNTHVVMNEAFCSMLSIVADGRQKWVIGSNSPCDAGGIPHKPSDRTVLFPGAPVGSLIGKIGKDKPFFIGKKINGVPPANGELFLAANTNEKQRDNSHGTIRLHITFFQERRPSQVQ